MGSEKIKAIMFWVFVITISILMNSCSARKVETNKEVLKTNSDITKSSDIKKQEDLKISEDKSTNTEITTKTVDNNQAIVEETVYEPKDSSKPASIIDSNGKKIILDNAKMTTKKSTQKNDTKKDEVSKIISNKDTKIDSKKNEELKSNENSKVDSQSEKKVKKTEKESWSVFNLLWLLIPIGLAFLLYWAWKRYRSLISI